MSPGKNCPQCGCDIGVWPIVSAALPNRIWCPHCGARLRYRNILGLGVALALIASLLGAGAYFAAREFADSFDRFLLLLVAISVGGWCAIELPAAWLLRRRYELVVVERRSP